MTEYSFPPTYDQFAKWVHDALSRLYDSPYLQNHPLAEMVSGSEIGVHQRSQHLRRIVLQAIRAIRPEAGVPAQSPDWRAYRILELRYIEGLNPSEAMQELAFGRSQFFREQSRMLEVLTTRLWEEAQRIYPVAVETTVPAPDGSEGDELGTREQLAQSEVERLAAQATWETVDLLQLLRQLGPVIDPLARSKGVTVAYQLDDQLHIANADRVLLRQAMLNVIGYALDVAAGAKVTLGSFHNQREQGIVINAHKPATHEANIANEQRQDADLEVCRGVMRVMGGSLSLDEQRDQWQARLVWPATVQHVLLLIDDNEGFADLFRRYLAGEPWRLIHAPDGSTARQIMAEGVPTVIALDVMMPKEDGWEILIALRNDPTTRDIPVVICSVMNEPHMAEALGAQAYLTKPVTQLALLRTLRRWG